MGVAIYFYVVYGIPFKKNDSNLMRVVNWLFPDHDEYWEHNLGEDPQPNGFYFLTDGNEYDPTYFLCSYVHQHGALKAYDHPQKIILPSEEQKNQFINFIRASYLDANQVGFYTFVDQRG